MLIEAALWLLQFVNKDNNYYFIAGTTHIKNKQQPHCSYIFLIWKNSQLLLPLRRIKIYLLLV